ncbi:hypothetical protein [Microbacterium xylanilyticum]
MSEQKPEAVWIFPEEPKRRGGRIALIIGLVVAALIAAAVVVLFLIPHGDGAPAPTPTPSASASTSATPTVSPRPTTTPTALPTTPATTPPPVPDPSVDQFRTQVQPRLDDASRGLGIAQGQSGDTAVQVIDSLQTDAQYLAGQAPPSSIASAWGQAVNTYATKLQALRAAYAGGTDASAALADARSALEGLRGLVGL